MAKQRKDNVIVVNNIEDFTKNLKKITELMTKDELPFRITKAKIKDDFCNYDFTIISGVGEGQKRETRV